METYFSVLPADVIYNILHELALVDIISPFQEESVFNFFMAYNSKLKSCYEILKSHVIPKFNVYKKNILDNVGRLECVVISPIEYEQVEKLDSGVWNYYYFENYYQKVICNDEYRSILLCNGNDGPVFSNNNFWKYMIYSFFKNKFSRVSYPDFINYRTSYFNFIILMKIAYIVSAYPFFDIKYNLYLRYKTYYECNKLKNTHSDLFKILILNFMLTESKGYAYLTNVMLEIIHNVNVVSLQILYHILTTSAFKKYITVLYSTSDGERLLVQLILSYLDASLASPNAAEFYMIPILNIIQQINPQFLLSSLQEVLHLVSSSLRKYNTLKINDLRAMYKV